MADQQQREPRAVFCSDEQLQDVRLDRDVERGGRLVGDQQRGVVGKRHRDHHALPLAAGKLVRISIEPMLGVREAGLRKQRR